MRYWLVRMLIVTPIAIGEVIHQAVIQGVSQIGAPWLIVSSQPAFPGYERELSINHTRALLHAEAVKHLDWVDYVLLLDSDVVIQDKDAIVKLKQALESGLLAACVKTKNSDHVLGACALVRASFYKDHLGPTDRPFECQCRRLARFGKSAYVPGIAAYEIPRT